MKSNTKRDRKATAISIDKSKTKSKTYQCHICLEPKYYSYWLNYEKHMLTHGPEHIIAKKVPKSKPEPTKPFICDICNAQLKVKKCLLYASFSIF